MTHKMKIDCEVAGWSMKKGELEDGAGSTDPDRWDASMGRAKLSEITFFVLCY